MLDSRKWRQIEKEVDGQNDNAIWSNNARGVRGKLRQIRRCEMLDSRDGEQDIGDTVRESGGRERLWHQLDRCAERARQRAVTIRVDIPANTASLETRVDVDHAMPLARKHPLQAGERAPELDDRERPPARNPVGVDGRIGPRVLVDSRPVVRLEREWSAIPVAEESRESIAPAERC